jgi:hypothetical protein
VNTLYLVLGLIGACTVYFTMIGVTWAFMPDAWTDSDSSEFVTALFGSLLWPLSMPMIAGVRLARWLRRRRVGIPTATAREVRR